MRLHICVGHLLLLVGATSTCVAAPDANLQAAIERLANEHQICGVAVALIQNHSLGEVYTASGYRPPLAVTPDSTFQAASLGKPLFAYAVLRLAEQGKLILDKPLVQYLTRPYVHQQGPYVGSVALPSGDSTTDPRLERVTARMVLNHTSGLPNWSKDPVQLTTDPGTTWQYSGAGYVLLQRAVEAITDEPIDLFMEESVLRPAQMKRSSYVWDARVADGFVSGLDASVKSPRPFTAPIAATTLYTSAEDYARFLVLLLGDAPLLKQTTEAPVTANAGLNLGWGLGWGIERTEDDVFIWHWGNNPGYRAFAVASVRTGNGFVMLADGDAGLRLAGPITAVVVPGAHRMFRFGMLNPSLPCRTLGVCS